MSPALLKTICPPALERDMGRPSMMLSLITLHCCRLSDNKVTSIYCNAF